MKASLRGQDVGVISQVMDENLKDDGTTRGDWNEISIVIPLLLFGEGCLIYDTFLLSSSLRVRYNEMDIFVFKEMIECVRSMIKIKIKK